MAKNNRIDLMGQTFGRLKVIRECPERSKNGAVLWLCECSCKDKNRNTVKVPTGDLRSGGTRSCGCIRAEMGMERWRNMKNSPMRKDSLYKIAYPPKYVGASGARGVFMYDTPPGRRRYKAYIDYKGKRHWLGTHDTLEAAKAAREAGEREHWWPVLKAAGLPLDGTGGL